MFFNIINIINTNLIKKNKNLIFKLKKNELNFLKIFIKLNIIKFIKNYKNKYIIKLNLLNKKKLIFNLKNFYKPSKIKYVKYKNIKKNNNIIILSTNKGIITNYSKKKLGGIVLLCLWN